jgi:hypothetical protein
VERLSTSFNRPGAKISEGLGQDYWRQGQATGVLAAYHAPGILGFVADLTGSQIPVAIGPRSRHSIHSKALPPTSELCALLGRRLPPAGAETRPECN